MRTALYSALLFAGLVIAFVGVNSAWSQEPVFSRPPAFPDRTSSFLHFISCINVRDGAYLNCEFRDAILGLKPPPDALGNNGGHQHDSGHPLIDNIPTGGFTCVDCTDANPALMVVQGTTNNREVSVLHALPEVTGQIQGQITTTIPRGFVCVEDCAPLLFTVDVRVPGLQELVETPDDDFVFKPRPSTEIHPSAHHGTGTLFNGIKIVARTYRKVTIGRKPRITDMSLPAGGMFDLNGKWSVNKDEGNGHVSHRDGHDVDFSAEDSGGKSISCLLEETDEMIDSLEKANPGFKQCYPDGHYHFRF